MSGGPRCQFGPSIGARRAKLGHGIDPYTGYSGLMVAITGPRSALADAWIGIFKLSGVGIRRTQLVQACRHTVSLRVGTIVCQPAIEDPHAFERVSDPAGRRWWGKRRTQSDTAQRRRTASGIFSRIAIGGASLASQESDDLKWRANPRLRSDEPLTGSGRGPSVGGHTARFPNALGPNRRLVCVAG